jgi:hypothetical protein
VEVAVDQPEADRDDDRLRAQEGGDRPGDRPRPQLGDEQEGDGGGHRVARRPGAAHRRGRDPGRSGPRHDVLQRRHQHDQRRETDRHQDRGADAAPSARHHHGDQHDRHGHPEVAEPGDPLQRGEDLGPLVILRPGADGPVQAGVAGERRAGGEEDEHAGNGEDGSSSC